MDLQKRIKRIYFGSFILLKHLLKLKSCFYLKCSISTSSLPSIKRDSTMNTDTLQQKLTPTAHIIFGKSFTKTISLNFREARVTRVSCSGSSPVFGGKIIFILILSIFFTILLKGSFRTINNASRKEKVSVLAMSISNIGKGKFLKKKKV